MILEENKNVILVTHGGVINVIHSLIDNRPFSNKVETETIVHAAMMPLKYNNAWMIAKNENDMNRHEICRR